MTASLIAVAMLALAAAPALAQYPPDGPEAAVSDTTVVAGEAITVVGEDWLPGSEVTIDFDGEVLGTAQVNEQGAFRTQVAIPADASPGEHTLSVTGVGAGGQARTVTITITVVETAGVTPGARLPATGSPAFFALVIATGLLATGTAAVLVARRRNRASLTG